MENSSKLILIIDDEDQIREDLKLTLELNDYNVIDAENGKIGVELAKKHKPDMIISDIMMPELDGYGVLKEIQKIPQLATAPFLFLSAKGARDDFRFGMNIGADDYIAKPFDLDELLDAIKTRLYKSEKSAKSYNEKFDKIKSNIYKSIPHEIRTPLNGILNNSEWLYKNLDSTSSTTNVPDMLKNIFEDASRLNDLFEKYLFLNKIEIIENEPNEINKLRKHLTRVPSLVINDICLYTKHLNNYFKFSLSSSEEIDNINMNESHFTKLIQELVSNASKFSYKNTLININTFNSKEYYHVQITNFGRGMSEVEISNISSLTQFGRDEYEQKGTGIGLTIVKKIMNIYNGKLSIQSEKDEKTVVLISIPFKSEV